MASKGICEPTSIASIALNPTHEGGTLGSDMPKSSIQGHPVMIICDLLEGALEQLQQILIPQTNPRVILEDRNVQRTGRGVQGMGWNVRRTSLSMRRMGRGVQKMGGGVQVTSQGARKKVTSPKKEVEEFKECLQVHEINKLLEMVDQFPTQLFLHTISADFSRSALHVAVLESSQTLIYALLEKLKEEGQSTDEDLEIDPQDFILKVDKFGLSAVDMVALIGNEENLVHFEQIFEHHISDLEILFNGGTNLIQSFEDVKMNLLDKASLLLDKQIPSLIRQITIRQITIRQWLLQENIDFVYCLHEASGDRNYFQYRKIYNFVKVAFDDENSSLLEALLNVRDKHGRSPLHGCTLGWMKYIISILERFDFDFSKILNMPDFCKRTPLHVAAAQGFVDVVTFLTSYKQTNLNATYKNVFQWKMKKNENFNVDDVNDVTPLHLAVIHNHVEVVEALLEVPQERGLDVNAICMRKLQFSNEILNEGICYWTPFQLAAYMGHERILQVLLKDSRLYDPGLKKKKNCAPSKHNMIPSFHLATSQFHPAAVKTFMDNKKMDILIKDKDENTALHYATMYAHGHLQIHANLHDYVTVSHFTLKPPKSRMLSDHDMITCIDILMQSGLDMEQNNKDRITPTLHPSCPEKVRNWWLQKMAKEAQENKNNLIIAANAISVIAALVATTSFVGPLQPPLGLLDDGNQTWLDGYSQVKHTSVQVFLFCDSLSFYLAIAAIVFAMLSSWPIPHEGLAQEVRIARRCVQVAILLLFGSIIFVICAFSAASIAIVPDQRWRYKIIVVISTSLGILICFLILFLSFMRLLTLISSGNGLAKKISRAATQIILWDWDISSAK